MAKATLLFLVSSDKHTGVGREALWHAKLLAEAGYRVLFCCQQGGTLQERAEAVGVWHDAGLTLPTSGGFGAFPLDLWRIWRLARREAVSVVFTYRTADHLMAGLTLRRRVPIVRFLAGRQSQSGMFPPTPSAIWLLMADWASWVLAADPLDLGLATGLRRVVASEPVPEVSLDAGVTLDHQRARALVAGVDFIPGGVDTLHFTPDRGGAGIRRELGIGDEHVVVGLVAPLKEDRGHDLFLRAFAKAREQAPELRALLVASSTRKEREPIQALAAALGVGAQVAIFDAGSRFEEALAAIDIGFLAHPGSAGTGRAALELMSMARPMVLMMRSVLMYLCCGVGPSAIPADPADLKPPAGVPRGDVPEDLPGFLARSLVELARDPELRLRMGQAGRALVEARFSRSALQRQLVALVERLSAPV